MSEGETITLQAIHILEKAKEALEKCKNYLRANGFYLEEIGERGISVYKTKSHPYYKKEDDDNGKGNLVHVANSLEELAYFCKGVSIQAGENFDIFVPSF